MKGVFVFWLVDVSRLFSAKNDEFYYRLEFIDDSTGELYKTYVSENNINYRLWSPVIDYWEPTVALGLSGVKKTVKPGILNADSKPHIIHTVDRDQFMETAHRMFYSGETNEQN